MRFISVLLFTTILFSCTKFARTDTAKGRVLNPITGEGIPDVEMKLLKTTSGIPGENKAVKSTTTDANGSYEISKTGLKSYSLSCNLSTDYYPIGWYVDGEIKNTNTGNYSLKKGKTLHADFYAVPYGNIILDIQNVNCQGANDSMQFTRTYQFETSDNGYSSYRIGCYSYLSQPFKVPIGYHYYKTKITRSGITTFVYDTIFVSETGTATIHIDY